MKKRRIYKTNIYILSEKYINKENQVEPCLKTEVEVLVVPNFRLGYATDILTGIKIPIAKEVQRFYFEEFSDCENSYLDENGNLLSYFVPAIEQQIQIAKKKDSLWFLSGKLATADDIIAYRRMHPDKKEYKTSQKYIFSCFDERVENIQTQKKYYIK